MCLLVISWQQHADYPLVVCANRDEFYKRPSLPAHFWSDHPNVFAGRDLEGGGSWLGVNTSGRFAALTNVRNPERHQDNARSRGQLVSDFLISDIAIDDYVEHLEELGFLYNGFNLLFSDGESLIYYSNHGGGAQRLGPGLYGLSNAALDTPWPKTQAAKQAMQQWLDNPLPVKHLATLLNSREKAADEDLPSTGISVENERSLSAQFIRTTNYGTRSSTALLVDREGSAEFFEQSYERGEADTAKHQLLEDFWK
ncbi:MAG: NRDE family protein [Gammaproteobacteria bacterium]|nr:NRDE family protein [Gammaproteobacteria bacterium]